MWKLVERALRPRDTWSYHVMSHTWTAPPPEHRMTLDEMYEALDRIDVVFAESDEYDGEVIIRSYD